MSMLAAPRRKQKFSADPRGNNWSKDGSKFGQKMLEKFGWAKGKGLGANEDGKVDHVKISVKNDTRGVGCSRNHADNWIAHQDDFNDLLSSLNQDAPEKNNSDEDSSDKVTGLESKSKASRSRVHYQKFTKGKDLSSKSREDMACIFGRRQVKPEADLTPSSEDDSSSSDTENKAEHGVITVQSTDSVQDYFAKKMAERKASMTSLSTIDKSEDEERPSFSTSTDSISNDADENKSVKKKVRFSLGDNEEVYGDTLVAKKKKSKKKRKNKDDEEFTEETSDTTEGSNLENRGEGCDVSEDDKSKKKRKRSSESQVDEESEGVKRKKSKKKKKEKNTDSINDKNSVESDEINSINNSDQMECETEDKAKSKKTKKNKKVKDDVCEDDRENKPQTNNSNNDSVKTKKKKKKRKHMPIVD
ncbi:PIN2/TERF1-interacting telomerase inhibitor 1-like isoform X2 [Pecten maximus]|uniref:PIN2/TERF1-interacting telomerase inhibitor 1-like isoform X2 n=1 Tax=Pecten maximus TaxID=6579 RepID=UPI0014588DB7|nr:PIN2/TERF1-interacting telomerase inhibitor 1-like isoform X2 [Pecten maximus]